MGRIMSCDYSLGQKIYLNLFNYFMILFKCNSIIILSLIIFYLKIIINIWIHLNRYKIF
jgi:hypothetical protein